MIETHLSWVFLAGDYAYKIKKPVNLGFLDFSTLDARRHYCAEELRLNQRTAPGLYLGVIPITGSAAAPRLGGTGRPIEYALKMRRFSQKSLASVIAKRGGLRARKIDALAAVIASFHATAPRPPESSAFGAPTHVSAPALANFTQIDGLLPDRTDADLLELVHAWTRSESVRLCDFFAERRRDGFVRECHGDLHLRNIVFLNGCPVLYDCIEFDPELRWIDVMNEIAFLFMDLMADRLDASAWRLLNVYLGETGDYAGAQVLRYYLVYRAMVRAKIACIALRQAETAETDPAVHHRDYRRYITLARSWLASDRPTLIVMHGLAGSGKSTVALALLERIGAIRIRSDVERKRLYGLAARARTHAEPHAGIYSPEATRLVYEKLQQLTRSIIRSGHNAIVDASFLARTDRDAFRAIGNELEATFLIASCHVQEAALHRRIAQREAAMSDASEAGLAILENQINTREHLAAEELAYSVQIDSETLGASLRAINVIAARLAGRTHQAEATGPPAPPSGAAAVGNHPDTAGCGFPIMDEPG